MYSRRPRGTLVIALSFVAAFALLLVPLPEWAVYWRPAWVVMTLIYWNLALPRRIGVVTGWSLGIVHDILSDALLGQHALGYAIVAYTTLVNYHKIRVFPTHQQALVVFFLILLAELPSLWMRHLLGYGSLDWRFFYPALSSFLLWGWVFALLRRMRRSYRVSE